MRVLTAPRPLRPIRLGPGLCAARALWQQRARHDRPGARAAFNGEIASFVPYFPEGPLVRVHFIIARRDVPLAHPERAQLEAACRAIVKTWPDFLLEALLAAHDPPAARDLFARYSEAFSPTYRDAFSAASAVEDIATIEQCRRTPRSASTSSARRAARAAPVSSCGATAGRSAVRAGAGARAHGLPRRRRAHLPRRAVGPRRSNSGFTTCCSPSPATARSTSARRARSSTTASLPSCAPMRRTTATTRSCSASASTGARSRCAHVSRYLRQIGVPYSQDYMWSTLVRHAGSRRSSSRCSRRGSIQHLGRCRGAREA